MNRNSFIHNLVTSFIPICLVVVSFFFLFTFRYEATTGDEVIVYKRAQILFENHRNPYDKNNLFSLLPPGASNNLQVWNAPILFTLGNIFLRPSIETLQHYWFYISTSLAFGTIISVVFIFATESVALYLITGLAILFTSVPYMIDIGIGQLGSPLSFMAVAGSLLFIKKYYRLAAMVLSVLAVKPHIFALLLFCLLLISFKSKRREFIYYFLGSVILMAALAELYYPGIWALWIYREQWPTTIFGATLGSLLSSSFKLTPLCKNALAVLPIIILSGYFCRVILKTNLSSEQSLLKIIFLALMSTALVAPYGFIFDHISTCCGILFFMSLDKKRSIPSPLIAIAILTFLATTVLGQICSENLRLTILLQLIQPISYFYIAFLDTSATLANQRPMQSALNNNH